MAGLAPPAISTTLANKHGCGEALALCVLVWQPGSAEAVAIVGIDNFGMSQNVQFRLRQGRWLEVSAANRAFAAESAWEKWQRDTRAALVAGRVETRKLVGMQLLIDGKPQGTALPPS